MEQIKDIIKPTEKVEETIEESIKNYSKVVVISCGGTINMKGNSCCIPSNNVNQILSQIHKNLSSQGINYEVEEIFDRAPDSSNMGQKEWERLIDKIQSIIDKKEKSRLNLFKNGIKIEKGGIVITHGTDTLDLTSLVISLEFSFIFKNKESLPIVFTASHSTIDTLDSDAKSNLFKSIYVAREKYNRNHNLPSGVYVLIGQDIHLASRITKVYTSPNYEGKYFFSFPSPIGMISGKKRHLKINTDFLNDLTSLDNLVLEKKGNKKWGLVEHINLDSHSNVEIISQLEKRISYYKSKYEERNYGVVIQGDFEKNKNFNRIIDGLKSISKDGTFIFFGSKTVFEKTISKDNTFERIGLIPKCLSHLKAKIKLSWLLRFDLTAEQVLKYMNYNIAGELVKSSVFPEWINYETFHPNNNNDEIVLVYPNIDVKVFEDAIKRIDLQKKEKRLFIYGFGDGHIPTANESILSLTNKFLKETIKIENNQILKNEDITLLVKELADKVNSSSIKSFFNFYHHIDIQKLKKIILQKHINLTCEERKSEIKNNLIKVLEKSDIKNLDDSLENFFKKIKISVDYNAIKSECKIIFSQEKIEDEKGALEYLINNMPEIIAERLIKEAIMQSDEKMQVIGQAIDNGIQIIIKSYAVRSKTNTMRYEMGNKLWFLGVDSELNPGLDTTIIIKDNRNYQKNPIR